MKQRQLETRYTIFKSVSGKNHYFLDSAQPDSVNPSHTCPPQALYLYVGCHGHKASLNPSWILLNGATKAARGWKSCPKHPQPTQMHLPLPWAAALPLAATTKLPHATFCLPTRSAWLQKSAILEVVRGQRNIQQQIPSIIRNISGHLGAVRWKTPSPTPVLSPQPHST